MKQRRLVIVAVWAISVGTAFVLVDPALAQSLAPITNKVNASTQQLVAIGQAAGGLTAAGAFLGWMMNKINFQWLMSIAGGGAGLAGISTIAGFVNS